jgi:superfamily II DNA or RNA helicase
MQARPYQVAAITRVKEEWSTLDRTLIVLPTGTGKTIVFSMLARDAVSAGGRVLILAHRDELIRQAADKLQRSTGLMCAVEKADETWVTGTIVSGKADAIGSACYPGDIPR